MSKSKLDFNFYVEDFPEIVRALPELVDDDVAHLSIRQVVHAAHDANLMLFSIMFEIDDNGDIVRRPNR
jgi:hypothetical protein